MELPAIATRMAAFGTRHAPQRARSVACEICLKQRHSRLNRIFTRPRSPRDRPDRSQRTPIRAAAAFGPRPSAILRSSTAGSVFRICARQSTDLRHGPRAQNAKCNPTENVNMKTRNGNPLRGRATSGRVAERKLHGTPGDVSKSTPTGSKKRGVMSRNGIRPSKKHGFMSRNSIRTGR